MGQLFLEIMEPDECDSSWKEALGDKDVVFHHVGFMVDDLEEAIALADRVVIMSAGPRARIMAEYRIPLKRPREISEIRLDNQFHEIHREIWSALKEEVLKGYQQTSGERAGVRS